MSSSEEDTGSTEIGALCRGEESEEWAQGLVLSLHHPEQLVLGRNPRPQAPTDSCHHAFLVQS